MKLSIFYTTIFSIIICVACTTSPSELTIAEPTVTNPTEIAIPEYLPKESNLEVTELSPTSTQTPEKEKPVVEQVTPTHTESDFAISESSFLDGPLVGYRSFDDQGEFISILDIGNVTIRQVRSNVTHPFGDMWYRNGCQLYVSNGLVDLQGNLVWKMPDLDWEILLPPEGAYNEVSRLSPDGNWLAYNILYGEQFYEDAEFIDIGIVNINNPTDPLILTNDGKAYIFAWSPDSQWLAYKHVDENGNTQLFRTSPDGETHEQLTFHSEKIGIHHIVWSPDNKYVAYAGFQSKDQGETGVGWIDIIDTNTTSLYRVKPKVDDFGGVIDDNIWWSLDGTQLVFAGREWQNTKTTTQIYWVDVEIKSIIDSFSVAEFPEGSIDEVHAVGNVNQILLRTGAKFFLLDKADKSYKQILVDANLAGKSIDSESAPFNFSGEEMCQP
jgi:hypothetical protein